MWGVQALAVLPKARLPKPANCCTTYGCQYPLNPRRRAIDSVAAVYIACCCCLHVVVWCSELPLALQLSCASNSPLAVHLVLLLLSDYRLIMQCNLTLHELPIVECRLEIVLTSQSTSAEINNKPVPESGIWLNFHMQSVVNIKWSSKPKLCKTDA